MEDVKKVYCSKAQKVMMVELLKRDAQLICGKFTADFTFKEARNRWKTIANSLNALPGCTKDWSQWKRTWQDCRTKVRGKKALINKHLCGTGGGLQVSETLSPIDIQILDLISPVTIGGEQNIPVPTTSFQFEEIVINKGIGINYENVMKEIDTNDEMVEETHIYTQPLEIAKSSNNVAIGALETKGKNKKFKTLTAAKHLTNSLVVDNDILDIGKQKLNMKERYYEKKLLGTDGTTNYSIRKYFCIKSK